MKINEIKSNHLKFNSQWANAFWFQREDELFVVGKLSEKNKKTQVLVKQVQLEGESEVMDVAVVLPRGNGDWAIALLFSDCVKYLRNVGNGQMSKISGISFRFLSFDFTKNLVLLNDLV